MKPIRTLIVDDEPLARDWIRVLLEADPEIEIVGECADSEEAIAAIEEFSPDLVFLDVQVPERNGFETLRGLDLESPPFVVFVTAYDRYAVEASEVHALDYVLKPFDDDRFMAAVARAKSEIRQQRDAAFAAFTARVAQMLAQRDRDGRSGRDPAAHGEAGNGARPHGTPAQDEDGFLERLVVKRAGREFFVDVDRIDWFEAADYYVRLHAGDDKHLLRITMKELERTLDPGRFIRIHRSHIVRIDGIRELQPHSHGEYVVVLQDGTKLPLSRSRRKRLERALGQRL